MRKTLAILAASTVLAAPAMAETLATMPGANQLSPPSVELMRGVI